MTTCTNVSLTVTKVFQIVLKQKLLLYYILIIQFENISNLLKNNAFQARTIYAEYEVEHAKQKHNYIIILCN